MLLGEGFFRFCVIEMLYGSINDLWYDSAAVLESDCSDEDFHSALNDMLPLDGSEGVSRPNISAVRDGESRRSSVHPVDVSRCSGSLNDGISLSMDDCSERDNGDSRTAAESYQRSLMLPASAKK
nr:hypothetical protein [Tanacetum cinerariifolium]